MNSDKDVIVSENAPVAVGAYPHARRVGAVSYTHLTLPTN